MDEFNLPLPSTLNWREQAIQRLQNRLSQLHQIDDNRTIDLTYLTWGEYQLFLDNWQERGWFAQPDHWLTTHFQLVPEQAHLPATGMRGHDVAHFCYWLNEYAQEQLAQTGEKLTYHYRSPSLEEANQFGAGEQPQLATWCHLGDGKCKLAGLSDTAWQKVQTDLLAVTGNELPPLAGLLDMAAGDEPLPLPELPGIVSGLGVTENNHNMELALAYGLGLDVSNTQALVWYIQEVWGWAFDKALDGRNFLLIDFDLDAMQPLFCDFETAFSVAHGKVRHWIWTLLQLLDFGDKLKLYQFHDLSKVKQFAEELENSPNLRLTYMGKKKVARRARLLLDTLALTQTSSFVEWRRAWRQYSVHFTEYCYYGYVEMPAGSRDNEENHNRFKQHVLDIYWQMQMLIAREEKQLSSWEGIRLVREVRQESEGLD